MYVGRKRVYAVDEEKKCPPRSQSRKSKRAKQQLQPRLTRPLGNNRKVNHRYVEQLVDFDTGIPGTIAEYFFSANGMYDPNITGVGHQPIGFDEISNFFDHYTVIYSKITIAWENNSTRGCIVGVKVNDNTTSNGTITNFIENGNNKWTSMPQAATGGEVRMMTMDVVPHKFLGRPNPLSEDDLRGSATSNPAEQCYWQLGFGTKENTSSQAARALVQIDYVAIWTEPTDLSQS